MLPDWLSSLYDPEGIKQLIVAGGVLLLVAIIFAETGILAGFFLPGDSLLVTAGVLCSMNPFDAAAQPPLGFRSTGILLSVAAVAGDWLNFWIGSFTGDRIWQRPDGRFYKRRYLEEAQAFYARWGGPALAIARFVPIARTFVPFVAGMARMRFTAFMVWNLVGAVVWIWSLLALGYWLGQTWLAKHLELVVLVVIAVSFVPLAVAVVRRWLRRPAAAAAPVERGP